MGDILYGVKLVILNELDPVTELVKAGGITCRVDTAEEVNLDPVLAKGNEKVLRSDLKILAVASTDDLLYGYAFKFINSTFDLNIVGLIEGGTIRKTGENITGYDASMLSEGATMKLFSAEIYVANYEGSSIKNYTKVTLNKCKGRAAKLAYKDDFFAPEFDVDAREATKAGKPIKSIDYIDALPPIDVTPPILTIITVTPVVKPAIVSASSSKLGGLYLVHSAALIDSISDLNALVNVKLGSYASIVTPGVATSLLTLNIAVGSYKVYAVDLSGNISIGSTNIILS